MTKNLNKRLLFLHSSSDYYGASKVLYQTIITCKSNGYDCFVILSEPGILSEKLMDAGIEVSFIKLAILRRKYYNLTGILNRTFYLIKSFLYIKHFIRSKNIGIIYSNTTAVLVGALVSKFSRVKHVWHIHEIIAGPRVLLWTLGWLMEYATDKNITVSAATFHHWNSINPSLTQKHKLICLFNGIDLTPYQNIHPAIISKNNFTIGMIGRVHFWKGQTYFIEIAYALNNLLAQQKNNNYSINYLMAGDPFPGYEYLLTEIDNRKKTLGLQNCINDLGYVKNNIHFFEQVDLLIVPSILPDPLPTVVLEAMASGLPVVGTKLGGMLDMIVPNETGILIPWDNANKAAEQIFELLQNQPLLALMSIQARKRVQSLFSIERYEKEILQTLENLNN